jgi:hypothetical protein
MSVPSVSATKGLHAFGCETERQNSLFSSVAERQSISGSYRDVSRRITQRSASATQSATAVDPDLALVNRAWDGLPEEVREQIIALVTSAEKTQ